MNITVSAVVLLFASFVVVSLSLAAWRLISSRSVVFNGLLSSLALLFAAYFAVARQERNLPLTYIIPFVVGMAMAGRAIGLLMRVRRGEAQLQKPGSYLLMAGGAAFAASAVAYFTLPR